MKLPIHVEQAVRRACGSDKEYAKTMKICAKQLARGLSEQEVIESLKSSLRTYAETVKKDPFAVNQ